MAIRVRLPSTLRAGGAQELDVPADVRSIAALLDALERQVPGLRAQLDDAVFNFAVNDDVLLHRVREHPLKDGDIVEIIPAISGGGHWWPVSD